MFEKQRIIYEINTLKYIKVHKSHYKNNIEGMKYKINLQGNK